VPRLMSFAGLLLLAWIGTAAAQSPRDLRGAWALEIEGRNLFVIKLEQGSEGLSGSLQRPTSVALTPSQLGIAFSRIQGPIYTTQLAQQRSSTSGDIVFSYSSPDGTAKEFLLRSEGDNAARLAFDGSDPEGPSVILTRAHDSAAVAPDWVEAKTYFVRAPAPPPNAELAAIFEADQADRKGGGVIDWSIVGKRDEARRERVRKMLDDGLVQAADDYYAAAFVFQHGSRSEDFLLAHALAMAAVALGRADASWISSATLDRFLHSTDRPQIFGTQYLLPPEGSVTQGKYDSALIPDSLRRVLGVSSRAQQEAQRSQMQQQRKE
jgi:hypothetical protein